MVGCSDNTQHGRGCQYPNNEKGGLVDWWIEMSLQTTENDMIKIPEEIILPEDVRLRVVVEGKPPSCYLRGEKGHMKARCSQREEKEQEMEQSEEQEKANDEVQEEAKEAEEGFEVVKKEKGRALPWRGRKRRNKVYRGSSCKGD
uniref:Uncharacterized protein n=1 Tax=Octopus bimaculoides TaxID=37653 RepID=A0A0L8HRU2_OCTBM